MVELQDVDIKTLDRKSSKGNQLKFERDGVWYKADYLGYEGLVEYTVSKLLKYSSLYEDEYVDYELEQISYNGQVFNSCCSRDFTDGWQLVTLERLFKQTYGHGLNKVMYSIDDNTERLSALTEQVERVTGIKDFGIYMSKVMTVDALFLNEDRHTHNLAVLTNNRGEYKLSPIFDNAAGLMSDITLEYPMGQDYIKLMDKVRPKTFCDDFAEQVDIAERLYGRNISFKYDYNEVRNIVERADKYEKSIRDRVVNVVMQTRRSYEYLFVK